MLTVIGCGNLNRSDDGVGVIVAQRLGHRLQRHPVPGVRVFDCGTAGMEVMFAARGSDALLIIDAAVSGSEPGAVFDVPGERLAALPEPSYSLHDFRWDHAIAAGRKIYGDAFPSDVRVWLVEASSVALGLELSQPVQAAADRVYARLLETVAEYAAARHATRPDTAVELVRGSLRIPASTYATYFESRDGALFMLHEGRLVVIPVDPREGGVLLKQRNAVGDRVVDAGEFLRAHGLDDQGTHRCAAQWVSSVGGLAIEAPPAPHP